MSNLIILLLIFAYLGIGMFIVFKVLDGDSITGVIVWPAVLLAILLSIVYDACAYVAIWFGEKICEVLDYLVRRSK